MRAELAFHNPAVRMALSPILAPASLVYAAALAVDRSLKSGRRRRLSSPVVSIGNITVGGTGKTPVLIRLVQDLRALGLRPAVLTRGYAGAGVIRREGVISAGGDTTGFSDEVQLVAEACPGVPIGVGSDRGAAADALLRLGPVDVFILDDGFQHWALERDLDVVCVDVSRPAERFLLPLGLLREPASALARARIVLLTRCELADEAAVAAHEAWVRRAAPGAAILRTRFDLRLITTTGATVPSPSGPGLAVSAIGHPRAFEDALRRLGLTVSPMRFPDHHAYRRSDLDRVRAEAAHLGAAVVITTKDWVKIRAAGWTGRADAPPLWIAEQSLRFDGNAEDAWKQAVADVRR